MLQYSQKRVYDPVIQSVSGLASIQADENDRPRMMRLIVPDKVTALTSAQAIAAALVQRYRTGKGAHVELAMLDATLSFAWGEGMARYGFVDVDGEGADPDANPHEYVRDMVFRTKDGYITCGAVQQKEWEGLCAALDKPEWLTDERFATGAARNENRDERLRMTEEALMTMTMAEATQRLNEQQVPNGVSGPVLCAAWSPVCLVCLCGHRAVAWGAANPSSPGEGGRGSAGGA